MLHIVCKIDFVFFFDQMVGRHFCLGQKTTVVGWQVNACFRKVTPREFWILSISYGNNCA